MVDENGTELSTQEKRIYPGTVIFIKKGELSNFYSFSDTEFSQDENWKKDLYNTFNEYVALIKDSSCGDVKEEAGC